MVADKDKTRRAVIDAQVYGKINLPYNFSVMVKANIFTLRINQNVINEYHHELIKIIHEYTVHQVHKERWCIGQTKRHHCELI